MPQHATKCHRQNRKAWRIWLGPKSAKQIGLRILNKYLHLHSFSHEHDMRHLLTVPKLNMLLVVRASEDRSRLFISNISTPQRGGIEAFSEFSMGARTPALPAVWIYYLTLLVDQEVTDAKS